MDQENIGTNAFESNVYIVMVYYRAFSSVEKKRENTNKNNNQEKSENTKW